MSPIIYKCDECPAEEEARVIMSRWLVERNFGGTLVLCPECAEKRKSTKLENGGKITESLKRLLIEAHSKKVVSSNG